jgi:hypothetical protein
LGAAQASPLPPDRAARRETAPVGTDSLGRPEVDIFKRFAYVCPLEIVPESIEKQPPPNPTFELVEIIDQDLARTIASQWRLGQELRDAYQALPERDAAEIRAAVATPRCWWSSQMTPRFGLAALCARMSETVPPPEITEEGETG